MSEAKGAEKSVALFGENGGALPQLENGIKKLAEKGLAGDVERVQIIMRKGGTFKEGDYAIVNGYLVVVSAGNKRYEMVVNGMKKLVTVIQL